jgi:hypothetical protein
MVWSVLSIVVSSVIRQHPPNFKSGVMATPFYMPLEAANHYVSLHFRSSITM